MQIDKTNLEIGQTYLAITKGGEVELDNETVFFEDQITQVQILPKPVYIWVNDGLRHTRVKEKISGELLDPLWYWTRNVESGIERWISFANRDVGVINQGH